MPKEFARGTRVADMIQREVALLIQQELKDPRLGMVTVSEVKVSRDLAFADVYYTTMPSENTLKSQHVLEGASGFLRSRLAKVIKARTVPKLRFHYDETIARGAQLSRAIKDALDSDERQRPQPGE